MSDVKKVFGVGIIGCGMIGQKRAKALGKMVLASDKCSLREVGGELVKYINPWSLKHWAKAILEMVEDKKGRKKLVKKIRENYHIGTWQSAGRSVQNVIEKLSR